jgi:hypothetical protein
MAVEVLLQPRTLPVACHDRRLASSSSIVGGAQARTLCLQNRYLNVSDQAELKAAWHDRLDGRRKLSFNTVPGPCRRLLRRATRSSVRCWATIPVPDSSPVISDLGWPVDFAQHYVKVGCKLGTGQCIAQLPPTCLWRGDLGSYNM